MHQESLRLMHIALRMMHRRQIETIMDMLEHGRPPEGLRERGPQALTDEELVAAILGLGRAGISMRTMARRLGGPMREHNDRLKRSLLQNLLMSRVRVRVENGR